MASFIMHTIAGEIFLNALGETYNVRIKDMDRKRFLLGNLIVDTIKTNEKKQSFTTENELEEYKMNVKRSIRKEKLITHFRDESNEVLCIKSPIPKHFLNKYHHIIKKDISALGYLFHLYTDELFFKDLFPNAFENLDSNYKTTIYDKDSMYIRIKKNGNIIPTKSFWAATGKINIYNDYTIMNNLLIDHFGISFNEKELTDFAMKYFINPGIEEVNYNSIFKIISATNNFIKDSNNKTSKNLQVFTTEQIIEFIPNVIKKFMIEYKEIINEYINNNEVIT